MFAGAILVIPGKKAYKQGDMAGKTYAAATRILRDAKITQNISALTELTPVMSEFGKSCQLHRLTDTYVGSKAYVQTADE